MKNLIFYFHYSTGERKSTQSSTGSTLPVTPSSAPSELNQSKKNKKNDKKKPKEEKTKTSKSTKEGRGRSQSKGTNHDRATQEQSLKDFAQNNENPVPLFVEKCTRFIEQEGLEMEGIYRVPGNRAHVDLLINAFEEGK